MGIYISGVKGLPEQVQENKENIKDIQEEIEGIDFDAIHNLENQVAENTQDINNMEGTIGTQNIAITNLGGRIDDLEDKTQDITRQGSMLYVDTNEVVLNADLGFEADSGADINLGYDNKILDANSDNTYININSSDEVDIVVENKVYNFSSTGLTFDGNPVGGTTLYQHNIIIRGSTVGYTIIQIINDSNTPYTYNTLVSFLYNNGFTNNDTYYSSNGIAISGSDRCVLLGVKATTSTILGFVFDKSGITAVNVPSANFVEDKRIQIA